MVFAEELIYEKLDEKTRNNFPQGFTSALKTDYIKCRGFYVPENFKNFGDRIKTMEIRDDDVWVCSFPKTGTTWVQEMVWCIANNFDYEAAKEDIRSRFPFLEFSSLFDFKKIIAENPEAVDVPRVSINSVKKVENWRSRRFIKTHLPFNLLPEQLQNFITRGKIIYIMRNPRDTAVSYYFQNKSLHGYTGSLQQFAESFLKGCVSFGPYPDHVRSFVKRDNNPNVLILKFEDMKKDLKAVIYKTAKFLGKDINENDAEKLLDHLSFSKMKRNESVNHASKRKNHNQNKANEDCHIRRGEVGDWKNKMDPQLYEKFEIWERDNFDGIEFTYTS